MYVALLKDHIIIFDDYRQIDALLLRIKGEGNSMYNDSILELLLINYPRGLDIQ